jgi:hypothetical protein
LYNEWTGQQPYYDSELNGAPEFAKIFSIRNDGTESFSLYDEGTLIA